MKFLQWVVIAVLAFGTGYMAYQIFAKEKKEINVLVFSKTESFRHESIADGQAALLEMSKAKGFTIDTTEDASVFQEKKLAKYIIYIAQLTNF